MDFQDPSSKMSKSGAFPNGIIYLNDSDDAIMKKVKSAVTDSGQSVSLENPSAGLRNLAEVYAILSGKTVQAILEENSGKMYGHFKVAVAEQIIQTIRPIREKAESLLQERQELGKILREGATKARAVAQRTLSEVYNATGLIQEKELS